MDTNLDSLIALLFASAAIFAMMIALYRNGALPLRGLIVVGTTLVIITAFLALTLRS